MNSKYDELYGILCNVKILSNGKYLGLVSKYGDKLVNRVIEDMILEDDGNIVKFEEYLVDGLYSDGGKISSYNRYLKDLDLLSELDKEELKNLSYEMVSITKRINEIIVLMLGDKFKFKNNGKGTIYFISIVDKVNYCLLHHSDNELYDELREMFNKFIELRDKIMLSNLNFVIYIVKKFYCYCSSNVSFSDLVQAGNLGLMRAIESYNPSGFDVSFATYAGYWIKGRIVDTIKEMKFLSEDSYYQCVKEIDEEYLYGVLSSLVGDKVLDEEFLNYMNMFKVNSLDKLDIITSYNDNQDSEFMESFSLIDMIIDDGVMIEDSYVLKESLKELKNILYSGLKKTYFEVLAYRYGFIDGISHTLEDTGKYLGITKQGVYEREQRALSKVREMYNQ